MNLVRNVEPCAGQQPQRLQVLCALPALREKSEIGEGASQVSGDTQAHRFGPRWSDATVGLGSEDEFLCIRSTNPFGTCREPIPVDFSDKVAQDQVEPRRVYEHELFDDAAVRALIDKIFEVRCWGAAISQISSSENSLRQITC